MKRAVLTWIIAASMAAAIGCDDDGGISNDGAFIGGACDGDEDCDERCERDGDFPEGVCTVFCEDDRDCPEDTACVDKLGGICLLTCELPSDCRGGYTCKGEDNHGHDGESLVCIGD